MIHHLLWILGGRCCSPTHTAAVTAAAVGDDSSVRTRLSAYLLFIFTALGLKG